MSKYADSDGVESLNKETLKLPKIVTVLGYRTRKKSKKNESKKATIVNFDSRLFTKRLNT